MKKSKKNNELQKFLTAKFNEYKKKKGLKCYYFHHFLSYELNIDQAYYYSSFYSYSNEIKNDIFEKICMSLFLSDDDINIFKTIVDRHNQEYKKHNLISNKHEVYKKCCEILLLLHFWQERPDMATQNTIKEKKQELINYIEELIS